MDLQATEKDDEAQVAETNEDSKSIVAKIDCILDAMRDCDSETVLQLIEGIKTIEDQIAAKIECLFEAMRDGDSEKALQLLKSIEDKDINCRGQIRPITLLGAAVFWNHMNVAQVLLKRGADPNMKCFDPNKEYYFLRDEYYGDCTPLGMLTHDDNDEMMKLLIKHGADVNALIQR
jgi:ankyrin repeat protein